MRTWVFRRGAASNRWWSKYFAFVSLLGTTYCCYGFLSPTHAINRLSVSRPDGSGSKNPLSLLSRSRTLVIHNLSNDGDEDDGDEDEDISDVDISQFRPPTSSLGWNSGRSPPSARKAMGRSNASTARIHVCSNCGSEFVKFFGRCPTCREWNSLQEHAVTRDIASGPSRPTFKGRSGGWVAGGGEGSAFCQPIRLSDINKQQSTNSRSRRVFLQDDRELNTVLGGGLMNGSLILLGGDPGVGKSTLLLQVAASIASKAKVFPGIGMGLPDVVKNDEGGAVWYVSGEETPEQIALRATRLGLDPPELFLLQETHIDSLCQQVVDYQETANLSTDTDQKPKQPLALVVIDSIQTMVCDAAGSGSTGGISQVRESIGLLLRLAKSTGIPVVAIGHVTKSGDVAGPRTVEHMVDTVLYLEGDQSSNVRMLRASKNRFGSSDEVGVYEMTAGRLLPVSDPSSLFLATRDDQDDSEGCAIAVLLEGMRAIAIEIQALVAVCSGDYGRKTVNGIPHTRLSLLVGVLQKHCGMSFARRDIYVNVVGRLRLEQGHTADLAVAMALSSSLLSIPIRGDTVFLGEVGLLGELRSVPASEKRIEEARRMGFSRVVAPCLSRRRKKQISNSHGLKVIRCGSLRDALDEGLVRPLSSVKKANRRNMPGKAQDLGLDTIMDDDDDDEDGPNIFL